MRVTNEHIMAAISCDDCCDECKHKTPCVAPIADYSADLLEARELIKEMRQMLLAISQYPIAFVCEDVRTLARNEWEKSKEYAE